jgi:hypothetical protein
MSFVGKFNQYTRFSRNVEYWVRMAQQAQAARSEEYYNTRAQAEAAYRWGPQIDNRAKGSRALRGLGVAFGALSAPFVLTTVGTGNFIWLWGAVIFGLLAAAFFLAGRAKSEAVGEKVLTDVEQAAKQIDQMGFDEVWALLCDMAHQSGFVKDVFDMCRFAKYDDTEFGYIVRAASYRHGYIYGQKLQQDYAQTAQKMINTVNTVTHRINQYEKKGGNDNESL